MSEIGSIHKVVFGIKIGRWIFSIDKVVDSYTSVDDLLAGIKKHLFTKPVVPHPLPPIERSK